MKKSVLTLLLAGVLTIGGTVVAFADDIAPILNCNQNGTTGVQSLMNDGLSFEEAKEQMLNVKLERVDTAVENGVITSERAEEIKNEMEVNSESCTTPGENRGTYEGYGLNQGTKGNGNCDGTGKGNRRGNGRFDCN